MIPFTVFKAVAELTDDYQDEDVIRLLTFALARRLLIAANGDSDLLLVRIRQTFDLIERALVDLVNNPDVTQSIQ